tara:strand:+ start:866 stop:1531 length:666 start_codon:yes stop_codon:yes gene_type:complete
MKGFTNTPYDHPGFPKIDAVGKFRQNAVKELSQQQHTLNKFVDEMKRYIGKPNIQSPKNSLIVKQNTNSPIKFEAYLDKSGYKKLFHNINREIAARMTEAMHDALELAANETQTEIMTMTRAFKGKYKSSSSAAGDMYDKIGESLWYGLKATKGANQFTSFYAGSYGEGQGFTGEPKGVIGSRGANLTELTAEGTDGFKISSHPLGGTKRLVSHLKNARGG